MAYLLFQHLFLGNTEDGNLLVGDGVEKGVDNLRGEGLLLVLVHFYDLLPVRRHFGQSELLT